MSDAHVDLAKDVVTTIEEATLPEAVTVERTYRITPLELKDLQTARVRVLLGNRLSTTAARRVADRRLTVLVGIQRKLDATDPIADADACNELALAIEDLFLGTSVETSEGRSLSFVESRFETPFDPEHAAEHHLFSTLLALTYRYAHEF